MAEQIPKMPTVDDLERAIRDTELHLEDFNYYHKGSNAPLQYVSVQAASAGKSLQAANEKFRDLVEKSELAAKEKDRFEARLTQADQNFVDLMKNFLENQRKYKPSESRQAPSGYRPLYPPETAKEAADMLRRDPGQKGVTTDANRGVMDHGVRVFRGGPNAIGAP